MSLLIACILIHGFQMSPVWYMVALGFWTIKMIGQYRFVTMISHAILLK